MSDHCDNPLDYISNYSTRQQQQNQQHRQTPTTATTTHQRSYNKRASTTTTTTTTQQQTTPHKGGTNSSIISTKSPKSDATKGDGNQLISAETTEGGTGQATTEKGSKKMASLGMGMVTFFSFFF